MKLNTVIFDLDGTLTQHRSPLTAENRAELERLDKKYKLIMVGAGGARRIYDQMGAYPIDIIGNYGMQYARYADGRLTLVRDDVRGCDKEAVEKKVTFPVPNLRITRPATKLTPPVQMAVMMVYTEAKLSAMPNST